MLVSCLDQMMVQMMDVMKADYYNKTMEDLVENWTRLITAKVTNNWMRDLLVLDWVVLIGYIKDRL